MYLADETWPDLDDYFETESLALVPLGSTEQHGPHLPLATDHLIGKPSPGKPPTGLATSAPRRSTSA